ncbi:MAG: hypothetical protein QXO96_08115, partial [Sulfolobales archaeon]
SSAFASSYLAIDGLNRFGNSESYIATLTIASNVSTLLAYVVGKFIEGKRLYKEFFMFSSAVSFLSLTFGLLHPGLFSYIIVASLVSFFSNLASLCLSLAIADNVENEELVSALKIRNLISGVSASLVSTFAWAIASSYFIITLIGIGVTISGIFISRELISTRQLNRFNNSLKLVNEVTLYLASTDLEFALNKISEISKSRRIFAPLLMIDRLVFGISSGLFFTSLPPTLLRTGSAELSYLALGLNSLASSLGYILVRSISIRVGTLVVLIRAFSMLSITSLMFYSPNLVIIPLVVMGVCWSFYDTILSYFASTSLGQGSLSVYMGMINLGATIGGVIAGYIIQNFTLSVIIAFILLLISGFILYLLGEKSLHLP